MENYGGDADQFAALVLQQLTAAGEQGAEYDPDEFVIRLTSGLHLYLGNIFRESHDLAADERAAKITHFLAAMRETGGEETWQEAQASVLPILRTETFGIDDMPDDMIPIARPALPFLSEMVAVDRPNSRSIVNTATLARWGVSADEVFATARENLRAKVGSIGIKQAGMLFFNDNGDGYCTSWPLIPGWLAGSGDGTHRSIAFMPDVDTLIVVPDNGEDLGMIFEFVEKQYREAVRSISPQGYTVDDDGTVIPLDQSPRHWHLPTVQRARCGLAVTEYEIQTNRLREQLDDELTLDTPHGELDSAYVGSVMFIGAESGAYTVTVWGEDVDYFLPEADYVTFCSEKDGEMYTLFEVPFAAVVEIAGLTPIPGLAPRRYEIREWPDAANLTRLAAAAVTR